MIQLSECGILWCSISLGPVRHNVCDDLSNVRKYICGQLLPFVSINIVNPPSYSGIYLGVQLEQVICCPGVGIEVIVIGEHLKWRTLFINILCSSSHEVILLGRITGFSFSASILLVGVTVSGSVFVNRNILVDGGVRMAGGLAVIGCRKKFNPGINSLLRGLPFRLLRGRTQVCQRAPTTQRTGFRGKCCLVNTGVMQ